MINKTIPNYLKFKILSQNRSKNFKIKILDLRNVLLIEIFGIKCLLQLLFKLDQPDLKILPTLQILSSQTITTTQQASLTLPIQSTLHLHSSTLMQQNPDETNQFLNQSSFLTCLQLLQAKAASASNIHQTRSTTYDEIHQMNHF